MPRKFFRKYLPDHESVRSNRLISRFGALLHQPNLWHLNRRSVSGGVAVGLFSGLVPGPLQMLTAACLAIPLRVNLPVALVTTLYTNPFTIVPLYLVAYQLGALLTGTQARDMTAPPEFSLAQAGQWVAAMAEWALSLGKPLAVGLVALATLLALIGYVAVQVGWRAYVGLAWRRRKQRAEGA
jgi:uncharacterized protein (DUF2062 family)